MARKSKKNDISSSQLRLWDGRIGRWLTTDPKGQYASPYLGMGNNPIVSIDPDGGKNEDWFYNSKTGEIYYNSIFRKGDENKLGKNWEHLGKNGMFGVKDVTLLKDFNISGNFEAITSYLDSESAISFMKEQGYNFNPVQEVDYHKSFIIPYKTPVPVTLDIKIIEKSKYMTIDYFENGKGTLTTQIHDEDLDGYENIARYKIFYSNNKFFKAINYITKKIYRKMSPTIYKSWDEFKDKNNPLVNEFIKQYGKQ